MDRNLLLAGAVALACGLGGYAVGSWRKEPGASSGAAAPEDDD